MSKFVFRAFAVSLFAAQLPLFAASAEHGFIQALQPYCGKAFAGRLITQAAEDASMQGQSLIVHFADCRVDEIRMPFHVGDDRSRTWVLRALPQGLQFKHDHRKPDGSHDELTMYGGMSAPAETALTVAFPADNYSKLMFYALGRKAAPANVWSFTLAPGNSLIYRLSRPGREFAVAFDLTHPVAVPPPAWGAVVLTK